MVSGDKWAGKDKLEQKNWYSSYSHFQINYEGDVDLNLWKTHPFAIAGDSRVMYMGTDEECAYIQTYTFETPWYTNLLLNPRGGNVGIGTITPDEKLTVNGTIKCRKVKVTATAGADFVFEPNYKLMNLQELENYVKTKKHLPEIATANEMQTNGLDLGENNIKLLQKIEELTLYIIELNKQNKKLEKRIFKLEK